jgi:calcium/calmodulin-dependent protein kinase I
MAHKNKKHADNDSDDGVLYCTIVEAKNVAATDTVYCSVASSFNKQRFKTKGLKKTTNPVWDQKFNFYISQPHGNINLKVMDKAFLKDDKIGEASIDVKRLENGEEWDHWFTLESEPKKKKGASQGTKGEIHVKLSYPSLAKKNQPAATQAPAAVKPEVSKPKRFTDGYEIGKELGRGGFSIVKEAKRKATGEMFAVKIIAKNQSEDELQLLQREIDIMKKLKHGHIIALEEVFDEPDYIYLVLELVTGGELFDQIVARGVYTEKDAAQVVKQILEAVSYMHENGIAHRDLKPENLLLLSPTSNVVKITDFGLSKDFGSGQLKTSCGTPDYVAPEVLKGQPYDHSVDIWSIGVITYILLCGFPPFYGNTDAQIFEKILKAQFDFPSPDWDNVSENAKQFVSAILSPDPAARPTAQECLEAPWLLENIADRSIKVDNRLVEYTDKRKKDKAAQQKVQS